MQLDVEFGQLVVLNDARVCKIAQARLVDHVSDSEALNSLILGRFGSTSVAEHLTSVITAVTITPVVSPLDLLAC